MMRHRAILFSLFLSVTSLAAGPAATGFAERDPRYRLQPTDVVEVQYRYTPEFNQTISIQPDGYVNLQLFGDLKLGGLTLAEARTAILGLARQRLNDPEVVLVLKEYEKPHITVGGEVTTPGRLELRGRLTVVEAIAAAGGFKNSAKHSQVLLFRRSSPDMAETRVIDAKRLMTPAGIQEDVQLQPGDVLIVPQNVVSKIARFIKWANLGFYLNPAGM